MRFYMHGWHWTVEGTPAACIVPAHNLAPGGDAWSSGPLVFCNETGDTRSATPDDAALPWADCPEARNDLTRACDTLKARGSA